MSPFFNPGPLPAPPSVPPNSTELRRILGDARGAVPIYIAGVNTGLGKLAGELCDGFHVHPFHTPAYLREVMLPAIAEGAAKTGRSRTDVTISASVFAATNEFEREFCRQQVSFYASTPSYRPVLEKHGWTEIGEKLSALASRGGWGDMPALISDAMLAEFCTEASTPAELAAALKERYSALADRLTLYIPFMPGEKEAWWRELTKEINS